MKLTNLIMMVVGMQVLLWLAGINTSIGYVLGTLGIVTDPAGITNSDLFLSYGTILAASFVASVTIGLLSKQNLQNYAIIPIVVVFITFLVDWFSIIQLTNSYCEAFTAPLSSCAWVTWVVLVIVATVGIGFFMALIDWWRGRD